MISMIVSSVILILFLVMDNFVKSYNVPILKLVGGSQNIPVEVVYPTFFVTKPCDKYSSSYNPTPTINNQDVTLCKNINGNILRQHSIGSSVKWLHKAELLGNNQTFSKIFAPRGYPESPNYNTNDKSMFVRDDGKPKLLHSLQQSKGSNGLLLSINAKKKVDYVAKTDRNKVIETHSTGFITRNTDEGDRVSYSTNQRSRSSTIKVQADRNTKSHGERLYEIFTQSLDQFERRFYTSTYKKLLSISPTDRRENGISFVQSGLFVYLLLMAVSIEMDQETRTEIENNIGVSISNADKVQIMYQVMSNLPVTSDKLKFRWSSRLVLGAGVSYRLPTEVASILRIYLGKLNGTESLTVVTRALNHMVEMDSGGTMHDTFEEDELSAGVRSAMLSTVYLRARWRAAPTLRNDSQPFRDVSAAPPRTTRMILLNDIMGYADLTDWDAEAIEISYATPGLTLLLLLPRGSALKELGARAAATGLRDITARMRPARVAATLPLYTLRMTLLLPSKFQDMGIKRLVETNEYANGSLRLSHAVQRLMFWAEAGKNAYKDDGFEWDTPPELKITVDRPYVFFVRWRNVTLMNGNFVL